MRNVFLSFLLQVGLTIISSGFQLRSRGPAPTVAKLNAIGQSVHEEYDTANLHFVASFQYDTRSVPKPRGNRQIAEFFTMDHIALLPTGTKNDIKLVKAYPSPEKLSQWSRKAALMGVAQPNATDRLLELSVTTPFLVFRIDVDAILGVKIVNNPSESSFWSPEVQFTLLNQTIRGDGPAPIVWMFDQLLGIDRTGASGSYLQRHHAVFRVKAFETKADSLAFGSLMKAEINLDFPSLLLRILPVHKSVIEKEASQSLWKSMERDVPPGLEKFREAYLKWLHA